VPGAGGRHNLRHARMIIRSQVAHTYPQQCGPKYLQAWPSDAPLYCTLTGNSHGFVTLSYRRGNGLGCHRHSRPVSVSTSAGAGCARSNTRHRPLNCTSLTQCDATSGGSSGHEPHPCLHATPSSKPHAASTDHATHLTSSKQPPYTFCDPAIHDARRTGCRAR
jgi:hypothetical protein